MYYGYNYQGHTIGGIIFKMKTTKLATVSSLGIASFTALSGLVLASGGVLAEGTGSTDNITVTLDSACTMTTTGNNSHSTTLVAGHLQEDIGTTNFDIACNDTNGYQCICSRLY